MVALLAASLGGAPAMAQDPNVLKVATTANITTWDPVTSFSTEAFYLANIYEPLLRINPPGSAEPYTPLLATEWSHQRRRPDLDLPDPAGRDLPRRRRR